MNNISFFRNKAKISQSKLSELVGVTPSTIGNYESGIRVVNINMGWKIVNAFQALGLKCQFTQVFPNPFKRQDNSTHSYEGEH
ncbi:helix-turn-helix domain-containing protein [Vibrio coralliilyticus]|uniref:helix-turn-helix domain-containing protein n=1 Tax=Vibrio coralliilyticus TaxID=190893 RepID=UPI00155FD475|nr:helix-turn-helix transcriptional regulator [Vibrio coralliilyticus]NRF28267.1 helix-turn-helix transcriptional regulator [Vibrio coralliilyticus]NRF51922.1 helix-turn-helix transcriptional regulator [Vibrio coralliilyticus]NRG05567.1 helix-turn-helix transcriptional regulator [Vibrio coralliilyticus]